MLTINLEKICNDYGSWEEISTALRKYSDGVSLQIKIERARHYSDLANSYLEAAFIGQQLSKHAHRKDFEIDWTSDYHPIALLTFESLNYDLLGHLIFWLGIVYTGDDESCSNEFLEQLFEYKDSLHELEHAFPELVDDYYANYVN